MSDEAGFQVAIDANPGDPFTRLVFADWLKDREDPRELGHRALAAQRKWAQNGPFGWVFWNHRHYRKNKPELATDPNHLPGNWFSKAFMRSLLWKSYPTRQQLEDEVALAFVDLPKTQQAKLLTPQEATA